jgi:hypothetical protein
VKKANPMTPIQKKMDVLAEKIVRSTLALAQATTFEVERAENRKKVERLRAAELAAPRKHRIYFRLARLLRDGLCPLIVTEGDPHREPHTEIVTSWLRTPEALRRTAAAFEIAESDVDRDGVRVVKSFLAALRLRGKKLLLEDIEHQYRKLYPRHRVPQRRSMSRTLRRKELWNFKRGRPKTNGDKSA